MLSSLVRTCVTVWGVLTQSSALQGSGGFVGGPFAAGLPQACVDLNLRPGQEGISSPFDNARECAVFVTWTGLTLPPLATPAVHAVIAVENIEAVPDGTRTARCSPVVIVTGSMPFQQDVVGSNALWEMGNPGNFNGGHYPFPDVAVSVGLDGTASYVVHDVAGAADNPNRNLYFDATVNGGASGKVRVYIPGLGWKE